MNRKLVRCLIQPMGIKRRLLDDERPPFFSSFAFFAGVISAAP